MTALLEYFGECTIRVTVLLEYQSHIFYYVVAICFITYQCLILFFFPLVGALSYAYSTFTAILNSLLFAVCVILAEIELLIFKLRKINWVIFTKVGLSFISLLFLTF